MTEFQRSRNPLWRAFEYVSMVTGLSALAVICLIWLPVAMVLYVALPARLGERLGRFVIMVGFRLYTNFLILTCGFRFDLAELDRLRDQGPLILAANHPSLLDAVLIVSRLPNVTCVMKASLMDNILFGAAARLARYIRNDTPLKMIQNCRGELERGAQLLIFPEGTRTGRFPVDTCLPSVGLISARTGVPVQALLIEMSTPYLGKAWPLFSPPVLPLRSRIRLGRRFPIPSDAAAFTTELEAYFREELAPDAPADASAP